MEIIENIDNVIKTQTDNSLVGHLNFIKSLALIIACMFKKEDIQIKEEIKEEKKLSKSQKNKKKGKKENVEVVEKITDIGVHFKRIGQAVDQI